MCQLFPSCTPPPPAISPLTSDHTWFMLTRRSRSGRALSLDLGACGGRNPPTREVAGKCRSVDSSIFDTVPEFLQPRNNASRRTSVHERRDGQAHARKLRYRADGEA